MAGSVLYSLAVAIPFAVIIAFGRRIVYGLYIKWRGRRERGMVKCENSLPVLLVRSGAVSCARGVYPGLAIQNGAWNLREQENQRRNCV